MSEKPGILTRVARALGLAKPAQPRGQIVYGVGEVAAQYDAMARNATNYKHWARMDALGPRAATTQATRQTLVQMSRLEYQNNAWYRAFLERKADAVLGTGPGIAIDAGGDKEYEAAVRERWYAWAEAANLLEKLRAMYIAKHRDGESFALTVSNDGLKDANKVDLRPYETEQVAETMGQGSSLYDDGVVVDANGNVVAYKFLPGHPGESDSILAAASKPTPYAADVVTHLFRVDRVGQRRGVPWVASVLSTMAYLRRFGLATLDAAEKAALIAFFIKSPPPVTMGAPGKSATDNSDSAYVEVDFARGMGMTLPEGADIAQLRSEHPGASHKEFTYLGLQEIGSALDMPVEVVVGAGDANFSSAKMNHLGLLKTTRIEQADLETKALDRLFAQWYRMGQALPGYFPKRGVAASASWQWDGREQIDTREAGAVDTAIANGTTSRAAQLAIQGRNIDIEDKAAADSYGVTVEEYRRGLWDRLRTVAGSGSTPGQEQAKTAEQVPSKPTEPTAEAPAAQPDAAPVQDTALNGAQVSALIAIAQGVVDGVTTPGIARALIKASFPLLPVATLDELVAELSKAPKREPEQAAKPEEPQQNTEAADGPLQP